MKNKGLTLIEVILTISLMAIFFASSSKLVSNQRIVNQALSDNNLAIYITESLRNRVLVDFRNGETIDSINLDNYKQLRNKFPLKTKVEKLLDEKGKQYIKITAIRRANGRVPRKEFSREVFLN
jgi:prepilin-type N-terminal cleavage/methylation domain-containing protein